VKKEFWIVGRPRLPDGTYADNASVILNIPNGIRPPLTLTSKSPKGKAEFKVVWNWPLPTPGVFRTVKLDATAFDEYGVEWSGALSTNLNFRAGGGAVFAPLDIPLHKTRVDVTALRLSGSAAAAIRTRAIGPLLLHDYDEMLEAIAEGLPSAAIRLAGKSLDGLLKVTGDRDGWWETAWDETQLGTLLQTGKVVSAIQSALGLGYLQRLRGSMMFVRHTGAHQKYTSVSIEEARASARLVMELAKKWWA
jgi:hypothetical protein